jgi:hypothetical protein
MTMVKRYHTSGLANQVGDIVCSIPTCSRTHLVLASDYEVLAEQYASYREAAGASIGADLNRQAIEQILVLEQLLRDVRPWMGEAPYALADRIDALLGTTAKPGEK